ncbi:transposase [Burkholderia cepacia]|nr:transposase [Burkholderia cepacia]KVX65631.1 transposase [Burkholderia cepacia]
MGPKTPAPEGDFFRQPLREQINLKHPLVRLTGLIDWDRLGAAMSASFLGAPLCAYFGEREHLFR